MLQLSRVRPLLFGRYAWLDADERQKIGEAGSGILVAPRLGLSARHVSTSFARLDEQIEARRRRRTVLDPQYKTEMVEGDFGQRLYQPPPQFEPEAELMWRYHTDCSSHDTDISVMAVEPKSPLARRNERELRFLEWQLLPPPVGAVVYLFGWGKQDIHVEGGDHEVESELWFYGTRVIENASPMWAHGLHEFPGFRLNEQFNHGLSGAPVVYEGRLVGIFSGPDFVASLWPLALMTYLDADKIEQSMADHFEKGLIATRDWEEVRGRVLRVPCDEALTGTGVESRCIKNHVVLAKQSQLP